MLDVFAQAGSFVLPPSTTFVLSVHRRRRQNPPPKQQQWAPEGRGRGAFHRQSSSSLSAVPPGGRGGTSASTSTTTATCPGWERIPRFRNVPCCSTAFHGTRRSNRQPSGSIGGTKASVVKVSLLPPLLIAGCGLYYFSLLSGCVWKFLLLLPVVLLLLLPQRGNLGGRGRCGPRLGRKRNGGREWIESPPLPPLPPLQYYIAALAAASSAIWQRGLSRTVLR